MRPCVLRRQSVIWWWVRFVGAPARCLALTSQPSRLLREAAASFGGGNVHPSVPFSLTAQVQHPLQLSGCAHTRTGKWVIRQRVPLSAPGDLAVAGAHSLRAQHSAEPSSGAQSLVAVTSPGDVAVFIVAIKRMSAFWFTGNLSNPGHHRNSETEFWSPASSTHVLVLPLTSYVTLGTSSTSLCLSSHSCSVGMATPPT